MVAVKSSIRRDRKALEMTSTQHKLLSTAKSSLLTSQASRVRL